MYPQGELTALAARKAALHRRIAYHRAQCQLASAGLAQPLQWADRGLALWRRLSPYFKVAAVPLALLVKKKLFPRTALLSSLLRFAPAAFSMFRMATKRT
jgi:hypothetical protein